MIGSQIGRYRITAKLGEGGMGVVFRGEDPGLGRAVAIKLLPAALAADPDRLARFEREAKLLAQLNHPNIGQVYGLEVHGEVRALVLELIEGPTLAEIMAAGPLPWADSLEVAVQIAQAIEAAHQKGIVHRDLKPQNIKMGMDGRLKVLDFGLAKALEPAGANPLSASALAASPTLTGATAIGMIVGTPAYMAPEQVKGAAVDQRADIWAFGVVLYEALCGRLLFRGDSVPETLALVLSGEIEWSALPAATPIALERLLRRCIERDPQRRMRDVADLRIELEQIRDAPPGSDLTAPTRSGMRRSGLVGVVALLAAAAVGAALAAFGLERIGSGPSPEIRFRVPPPSGVVFASDLGNVSFAVSPDGSTLAFVGVEDGGTRIWLRPIDSLEARPLAGTEGARSLTWSPDGRSIAFFAGDKFKRLGLEGGSPVPISDVPAWLGFAASWGARDEILLSSGVGQAIYRVAAAGGPLETLMEPDASRDEVRISWPRYLADGRGFLYLSRNGDYVSTLMQVEPGAAPRAVGAMASRFELVEPDLLVFAHDGALLAQRFERAAGRLVGTPISIAPAVRYFLSTSWAGFAASPTGTLFYASEQTSSRLHWIDRGGRIGGSVGPEGDYFRVALSPDGRSILADRAQPGIGNQDLWQIDGDQGGETRLTSHIGSDFAGLWLGDGKSIVYSAMSTNGWSPNLVRRHLGTGREETLLPRPAFQLATDVTSDGRLLAFVERSAAGNFRAWTLRLDGQKHAAQVFSSQAQESQVRFSPDGKYVAYLSDESGTLGAYVAPLESPGDKRRLFAGTARLLRWRRDGREIVLLTPDGQMLAIPVAVSPRLELGSPVVLFTLQAGVFWRDFDVTADGSRFLAVVRERAGEAQPAAAILNWRPPETR